MRILQSSPIVPLAPPPDPVGYHTAVSAFKRRLIQTTLEQVRGNRTHAARALGLQRTYLLRLIRELGVEAPPPPPRGRSRAAASPGAVGGLAAGARPAPAHR